MICLGHLAHARFQLGARHHVVDQADAFRFLRAEAAAGEHQLHRVFQRQIAREPLQPAAAERREPDTWLGQRELRVVGRDREIACSDNLDAAAEREAVHGGDHGLRQIEAVRDAAEAGRRMIVLVADLALLQVAADAERPFARAGDHRDAQCRVCREVDRARRKAPGAPAGSVH